MTSDAPPEAAAPQAIPSPAPADITTPKDCAPPPSRSVATQIRLAAAGLSIAVGGMVLFGWAADLVALTQIFPGVTAMNPLTAVSFIVLGVSLALHSRLSALPLAALSAVVVGIGVAKLGQLALGYPHGLDQLLFADRLGHAIGVPPNRMAPNTAFALGLVAMAMAAAKFRSKAALFVAQGFSVIVIAIALFGLVGYLLGLVALYEIKTFNPMALHTAIALLITAVGVFSCNPQSGLMRIISDRGPAGQLARKLLPLAIMVPVLVALLRLSGEKHGFFSPGNAIALGVLANVVATFSLLLGGVLVLYRSDLERRQLEFAVRRSESEYRLAERMGRLGHWRQILGNDVLECSDQFTHICGLTGNEPVTQEAVMALYHPDDAVLRRGFIDRAIRTGDGWDSSARIRRSDGGIRHVRSYGESERDENGKLVSLFGVIVDVTELEVARREAESAMKEKSAFLANMSHEVRTPLNSIIGFTDLMLEDAALAPGLRRQLNLVKNSGDALLTVVNDILDFSKMEAGVIELAPRNFDLHELLHNSVSIIHQTARAKGLEIALNVDDEMLTRGFFGDDARLRQVLLNLLGNAVKFTAEGRIVLDAACGSLVNGVWSVMFAVSDTGSGIPKDLEERLFQRFSQTDSSISRKHGGTGLGLAICKTLVGAMGGSIGYRPTAEGGSQFWFEVPLSPIKPVDRVPVLERSSTSANPMRILVAEDVEANQELAIAMLQRSGHQVEIANNGAEAVNAAQKREFDLILMDIQMPVMDGLTATRLIRRLPGKAGATPIIALSANVMAEHVELFREAGMSNHVAKPVKLNDLNAMIAQYDRAPKLEGDENTSGETSEIACFDRSIYEETAKLLEPDRMTRHLGTFLAGLDQLSRPTLSPDELGRRAHMAAGQAGMLGFMAIADLCRQLETAVRFGHPTAELIARTTDARAKVQATVEQMQHGRAA